MALHSHKFMRCWREITSNTAYHTIITEPSSTFFRAGAKVAIGEKWVCHGDLRAVASPGQVGGIGMRIPFLLYKAPGSSSLVIATGTIELIGGSQFAQLLVSGSNLLVQVKAQGASGSSIVTATLDAYFVGGPGPTV